jgi:signal transduction histidine kinase
VSLVQEKNASFALECGSADHLSALGLHADQLDAWRREAFSAADEEIAAFRCDSPHEQPLLLDLLRLAEDNRRLQDKPARDQLQRKIDVLQSQFLQRAAHEEDKLLQKKLEALAEFSAGAAHEINNPLAVISGQAQYLLIREMDSNRKECLQTIIQQTKRVHALLMDLMLYARPAEPNQQDLDAGALMRQVAAGLQPLAHERNIQLHCPEPEVPITLSADSEQIVKALGCLLKNAIEAASENGWVRIHVELPHPDLLHFVVEDNGKGLSAAQKDHLFDPFYSGRAAGRGRGLGLPIAWRLAKLHGGDVFWQDNTPGPTRFILQLPIETDLHATGINGCHKVQSG